MSNEYLTSDALRINHERLKDGRHAFQFRVGTDLFQQRKNPDIQTARIELHTELSKSGQTLDMVFRFQGNIGLTCDRCLLAYEQPIELEHRMVFSTNQRMAREGEQDAEVRILNPHEPEIDLAQDVYDLIAVQVPFRKVPDCEADPACQAIIEQVNGIVTQTEGYETALREEMAEEAVDPRWEALKKFRDQDEGNSSEKS